MAQFGLDFLDGGIGDDLGASFRGSRRPQFGLRAPHFHDERLGEEVVDQLTRHRKRESLGVVELGIRRVLDLRRLRVCLVQIEFVPEKRSSGLACQKNDLMTSLHVLR